VSRLRRILTATLVVATLPVAGASADVAGPDDSIAEAFGPLAADTLYSGRFKSETDVDYLSFDVARAGQTLHFDVANTVRNCASVNLTGCPLYATLLDGEGRQLGGEGSSAGTGAVTEDASRDAIDWTFDAPGRYFVAMDSDGDRPTYGLQYRVVAPAAGGAPGTTGPPPAATGPPPAAGGSGQPGAGATAPPASAPGTGSPAPQPIASLRVPRRQRGPVLRVRLDVGRPLRGLTVRLEGTRARTVALRRLRSVGAGKRTVTLRLDAVTRRALSRRGRLALRLRIVATPVSGAPQTARRSVLFVRR
jgi:hypothetical protein